MFAYVTSSLIKRILDSAPKESRCDSAMTFFWFCFFS